jgi:hypothetical protein
VIEVRAQPQHRQLDQRGVAEAQRRPVVGLGVDRREADPVAVEEVDVRPRPQPGPEQLLERQMEEVEEPRVVDDAGVIDVGEADRMVVYTKAGIAPRDYTLAREAGQGAVLGHRLS